MHVLHELTGPFSHIFICTVLSPAVFSQKTIKNGLHVKTIIFLTRMLYHWSSAASSCNVWAMPWLCSWIFGALYTPGGDCKFSHQSAQRRDGNFYCQKPKEKPHGTYHHQCCGVYPKVPASQPAKKVCQNPTLRLFGQSISGQKPKDHTPVDGIRYAGCKGYRPVRRNDANPYGHRYYNMTLLQ